MLATTTVRLVHHVQLRHTVTGRPLGPLTARLDVVPYGWSLRVRGEDVVVTARDGVAPPAAPPTLTVSVADPLVAVRLATPVVDVLLTTAQITVDVEPSPMTLAVELSAPTGAAQVGRTVTARAVSGPTPRPTLPLPETTTPGTYRCAPVTWTDAFVPLDLMVNGTLLRQLTVDLTRAESRVRLVDTT